jgi:hypothetical protein
MARQKMQRPRLQKVIAGFPDPGDFPFGQYAAGLSSGARRMAGTKLTGIRSSSDGIARADRPDMPSRRG